MLFCKYSRVPGSQEFTSNEAQRFGDEWKVMTSAAFVAQILPNKIVFLPGTAPDIGACSTASLLQGPLGSALCFSWH